MSRSRFPRLRVFASLAIATVSLAASPAPQVPDGDLKVRYKISFIGFDLARANLAAKIEHGLFTTRIGYRTTGIVKVFSGASGDVTSSGAIESTRLIPTSFSQNSKESGKEIKVNLSMAGGTVKAVEAVPEQVPDPGRVLLKEENKKNVLDPITALIIPVGKAKEGLAAACNRTIPIFDGWTRFDINLSFKSTQVVDKAGYKGEAVTCAVRWVPIAGHVPDRKGTKFMTENKDIEVTLAPIGDTGMMAPLHIGLQTLRGHIDVDALEFSAGKP